MMSYAYGLEKENVRCRVNIAGLLGNNSNSTLSSTANTVAIINLRALQDTQKLSPLYWQLRFELLIKNMIEVICVIKKNKQ